MRELVAIEGAGGPGFVEALAAAWDDGDAVLPVDPRLPAPARERLLDAARPHVTVGSDGRRSRVAEPGPPLHPGDALVVATSGTTGDPKLVVHTRGGLEAHAGAVHRRLGVGPGDRWLACLPLAHLGGLGVVLRSLLTDTPVDVLETFDADAVAAAPKRYGSTLVSLVPTALDRTDTRGYRWVVLGGSADPVARAANVVRTYGTTETGGGVVYDGDPLDGVEVRVDESGSIAVRSPVVARGLRHADGSVHPIVDGDGWYATGDTGAWEPDGDGRSLVVHGRTDDMIVTGGENVWPIPVEERIRTHPKVLDVAVVARTDPEWGQRVVAVVVPAPGESLDLEEVRTHVRAALPAHAAPREVHLVADLPRTALGKVRRREVAAGLSAGG